MKSIYLRVVIMVNGCTISDSVLWSKHFHSTWYPLKDKRNLNVTIKKLRSMYSNSCQSNKSRIVLFCVNITNNALPLSVAHSMIKYMPCSIFVARVFPIMSSDNKSEYCMHSMPINVIVYSFRAYCTYCAPHLDPSNFGPDHAANFYAKNRQSSIMLIGDNCCCAQSQMYM